MNQDIHTLSNEALAEWLNVTVREERRITIEVLRLLREVERRELFASLGFSSLFAYCVEHLKYSESAAQRRIVAMRALHALPELEEKIASGKLSLSVLSLAESALKQNAKREQRGVEISERRAVFQEVEGLSRRQAEEKLVQKFNLAPVKISSTERPLTNGAVRIVLEVTEEEMEAIEELRRLSSRPQTAKEMLLSLVRAEAAKRRRQVGEAPLLRRSSSAGGTMTKRMVWVRAKGQCEHRTPVGSRCISKHTLELDHVLPRSHGGGGGPENLRLLCRAHHRLVTTEVFGREKMQVFRPALEP